MILCSSPPLPTQPVWIPETSNLEPAIRIWWTRWDAINDRGRCWRTRGRGWANDFDRARPHRVLRAVVALVHYEVVDGIALVADRGELHLRRHVVDAAAIRGQPQRGVGGPAVGGGGARDAARREEKAEDAYRHGRLVRQCGSWVWLLLLLTI